MLERFKRSRPEDAPARHTGSVATAERPDGAAASTSTTGEPVVDEDRGIRRESTMSDDRTVMDDEDRGIRRESTMSDDRTVMDDGTRHTSRTGNGAGTAAGLATTPALEAARARQRDEFGGINWGASFF